MPRILAVLCLWLASLSPAGADTLTAQFENDLWGSGSDKNYTHGSRFSWVTDNQLRAVKSLAKRIPWMPALDQQTRDIRFSVALGQNIFTPEDISRADLITDDRPYAGWLYLAGGVIRRENKGGFRQLDALELNLGVVGPAAHADDVQTQFHKLIDTNEPRGWGNQLRNEPGVILQYDRQWQFPFAPAGLEMDATPHLGGALGNIYTYLAGGLTLRLGSNLRIDFGPPLIRPSLPGSGYFEPRNGDWGWYLFIGQEGRAVARNIFLDGNSFQSSHGVKRKPLVLDTQVGAVLMVSHWRFSFTNVFRSLEFEGQDTPSEFGAVSASFLF